jgi:hypothetical protein
MYLKKAHFEPTEGNCPLILKTITQHHHETTTTRPTTPSTMWYSQPQPSHQPQT